MRLSILTLALVLTAGPATGDELDDAYENLKKAEASKDAAQVKRLAAETHLLAAKVISAPAPENAEEKEQWALRVTYAKEIDTHTEYALFATAVQQQPAGMVEFISALEEQNQKSKYLDAAYGPYLVALNATAGAAKTLAAAEKALANFPENEDLLLLLADDAVRKKQSDKALRLAARAIAALTSHPRPEGVPAADWERRRSTGLGRSYWTAGVLHAEAQVFGLADKELRAALPYIKGNNAMMGAALFHLGVANHQLGRQLLDKARVLEGAKFSEQAAVIPGPYAQQALHNAAVSRAEAGKMR